MTNDRADLSAVRIEQCLGLVGLDTGQGDDQRRVSSVPRTAPGSRGRDRRRSPAISRSMRRLRILSFSLVGRRSTIRLPRVLPICTIAPVEIMFRTILVAVPAFKRVEPEMTSAPTSRAISRSTSAPSRLGRLQAMPTVAAPRRRRLPDGAEDVRRAPGGGDPDDQVVARRRPGRRCRRRRGRGRLPLPRRPASARSGPPAISPTTISGGVLKVGGHSAASRTPRRPDVPAPT